jgi:hypothetical protein
MYLCGGNGVDDDILAPKSGDEIWVGIVVRDGNDVVDPVEGKGRCGLGGRADED